jgi:hypothetical protein
MNSTKSLTSSVIGPLLGALLLVGLMAIPVLAEEKKEPSFLPTWKLLNKEGKQQFMAGYLQGWRAASRVTELATDYIRENPDNAVSSLESLSSVYEASSLPPDTLVMLIDQYYSDPANQSASLSMAVTAARGAFGRR